MSAEMESKIEAWRAYDGFAGDEIGIDFDAGWRAGTEFFSSRKPVHDRSKVSLSDRNVVIVTGPMGCGKTKFLSEIAFENGNFVSSSMSHLRSRFRGDLEGCDTVFVDDCELDRKARLVISEFASLLKIRIEKKGEDEKEIPTPRLIIATDKPLSKLQRYLGYLMSRVLIVPFSEGGAS